MLQYPGDVFIQISYLIAKTVVYMRHSPQTANTLFLPDDSKRVIYHFRNNKNL